MLEKIIEIAKNYCTESLDWSQDTSIMSDMELSSMEFFEFICAVEDKFKIHTSERQLKHVDTLGDLMVLIREKQ